MRFLLFLPLMACVDAGHLGNPVTLPARAVLSGIENATYQARRDRVSEYLTIVGPAGLTETTAADLWDIAGTPEKNHTKVLTEIGQLERDSDWPEKATVIVMVHS